MPNNIKSDVLSVAHESKVAGYYAVKKTAAKFGQYFYWVGLLSDVREYCRSCDIFQKRKPTPKRPHHTL